MALVSYSDSEESDTETSQLVDKRAEPLKSATNSANFAIHKSNPVKIRINLEVQKERPAVQDGNEEPAAKRARIGGGSLSGFNALLPAPKAQARPTSSSTNNKPVKRVFSLKTGAEPGFNRDSDAEMRRFFAEQDSLTQTNQGGSPLAKIPDTSKPATNQNTPQGNAMRFQPLSVARNSKKKTNAPLGQNHNPSNTILIPTSTSQNTSLLTNIEPLPPQKINLFSAGPAPDSAMPTTNEAMYVEEEVEEPGHRPFSTTETELPSAYENHIASAVGIPAQSHSLETIANDLHLSTADRRQLFGRNVKGGAAVNIVNFNTDQEYAANEILRSTSEQTQHNPVRGIAPGKHSLKQLMNSAITQKDALEESFASGKRNKREAGNRYGW